MLTTPSSNRSNGRPRPRGRLPRFPLPAKLLLSYLLLLAIAAVPTFLYIHSRLDEELIADAKRELLETARLTAGVLSALPPQARWERARDLARMTGWPVSIVGATGDVVFDSEAKEGSAPRVNHREWAEVKDALTHGTGADRRVDAGVDTIYAAARMSVARDEPGSVGTGGVVRLWRPLSQARTSTAHFTRFSRNIQAAAISFAILLSLFAAIQFLRPLQKVTAAAEALGAGDLAARSGVASDDEVGDAGRAIDSMAAEIRRRLANAGSGDAVLSQLVDALPVPCVVFEVTGEVLALNGAARLVLRLDGPNANRRLKDITSSPGFARALEAAEGDGEPEPIDVEVLPGLLVRGTVHVLKRPGTAPLYVLLGDHAQVPAPTTLPPLDHVRARVFADVLVEAEAAAAAVLEKDGVGVEKNDAPTVMVVDVDQRVPRALTAAIAGCAHALAGRHHLLALDIKVEPTRVRLAFEADVGSRVLDEIRPLLEPLGGGARVDREGATTLWLPRA